METPGPGRVAQSGKSSLFNALTGGQAPVASHPFTTTETSVAVALAARRSPRRPGRDEPQPQGGPRQGRGRRHRRAGRRVRRPARGWATASWPASARSTPCARAAGLRGRPRCPGDTTRSTPSAPSSSSWSWPTLATLEPQSDKRRKQARLKGGQEPGRRGGRHGGGARRACQDGVPLYRAGLDPDGREPRSASPFLLTDKPVLAVVNLGEDQLERCRGARRRRSPAELGGRARRSGCASSSRPRRPGFRRRSAPSCSRASASARGRCRGWPGRAYHAARPPDVPHHRGQGVAGLELPRRGQRAGVRGGHPLRPAAGLHPGRGHPLGRAARARRLGAGQGGGAAPGRGQGLRGARRRRARDPVQRLRSAMQSAAGCCARGGCWRPPRSPTASWSAREGLPAVGLRRRPDPAPHPLRSTPSACGSPSTWPSSTGTCVWSTWSACARGGSPGRVGAARPPSRPRPVLRALAARVGDDLECARSTAVPQEALRSFRRRDLAGAVVTPPRIPGAGPHEERGGAGGRLVLVATPIGNLGRPVATGEGGTRRRPTWSAARTPDGPGACSARSACRRWAAGVAPRAQRERRRLRGVLDWLEQGRTVALVSDAGHPRGLGPRRPARRGRRRRRDHGRPRCPGPRPCWRRWW